MCLRFGCYRNRNFTFPFKFSKCSPLTTEPPHPDGYLELQIRLAAINLHIMTHNERCTWQSSIIMKISILTRALVGRSKAVQDAILENVDRTACQAAVPPYVAASASANLVTVQVSYPTTRRHQCALWLLWSCRRIFCVCPEMAETSSTFSQQQKAPSVWSVPISHKSKAPTEHGYGSLYDEHIFFFFLVHLVST